MLREAVRRAQRLRQALNGSMSDDLGATVESMEPYPLIYAGARAADGGHGVTRHATTAAPIAREP